MGEQVSLGDVVLYTLTERDAAAITKRRADRVGVGNPVAEGDEFPARVVRVLSAEASSAFQAVNLRVSLDGDDTYWRSGARSTSAWRSTGTWRSLQRVSA